MEEKLLGKITSVRFGYGGYQEAMLGIWLDFSGKGFGISDGRGTWVTDPGKSHEWSKADQTKIWGEMVRWIRDIMRKAHVEELSQLKGKPVEVTIEDQALKSWRILTEVL